MVHVPQDDYLLADTNKVADSNAMKTPIEQLEDCLAIQVSDGNWNVDPYMHGMANGMILAMAIMKGEEPKYLDAPKVWLKDIVSPGPARSQANE